MEFNISSENAEELQKKREATLLYGEVTLGIIIDLKILMIPRNYNRIKKLGDSFFLLTSKAKSGIIEKSDLTKIGLNAFYLFGEYSFSCKLVPENDKSILIELLDKFFNPEEITVYNILDISIEEF